jgi:hypothetical protein
MNIKRFASDFVVIFAAALLVNVIVTYLYSLIVHGAGVIDWETAFRTAIILSIVLSWIQQRDKK